ncbi:hypothetical protein niasHT_006042 [Heterodera trifolii]|uniref:Integrase catalytic domain-containing protein n=1 Tax=Heterodera trifolii TaxID=157864 RepID=A0ABD2MCT5_9BILA
MNLLENGNLRKIFCVQWTEENGKLIIDSFSKYMTALPLREQSATTVTTAFVDKFLCQFGVPKIVVTDCGTQFLSSTFESLAKTWGFKHQTTVPYHQSANGQVERFNRTLANMLVTTTGGKDWAAALPMLCFAYNSSINAQINHSPFFVLHGFDPRLPSEMLLEKEGEEYNDMAIYVQELTKRMEEAKSQIRECLKKCANRMIHQQKSTKEVRWTEGMLVLRRRNDKKTKLEPNYDGPFRVIKIEKPNLQIRELDPDGQPFTVHMDQCKPYFTNEEARQDTETSENGKPKHKNRNKKLGDTKLEESDEEMLEIKLDGEKFTAYLNASDFPGPSIISRNLIKNAWEIFEDDGKYVIMWIFDENFKLRISNGRDEMFLGKGVWEFLENSGNLMMENGKAFYFEQFTDQLHQVFVQSITPEVWITLRDPPLKQTTIHFDPCDMTNKFTNFQKHSFHIDSFHHNSLDCLQPNMSRFDKTYSFSNCSTRRNSSPTPPAITISSSDSEDEAAQQQQKQQQHNHSSEGSEPRPYAPILTSFPAEQVEIIRPDQVANFKKQHRLAEIERQIQLMQQAKAQIENEEEDEKQIQALRKQSEKTKKERKQKESEERHAKLEARRAEAEKKAKEEAKKQKEDWKRALRRPAVTAEEKARKESENEIRKEAEAEARKELEDEAQKEAEKKAQKEAKEAKKKTQKEAEEAKAQKEAEKAKENAQKEAEKAKEKTQKEAEEAKAQKEREEKVKKKTEGEENDRIIARGIKKRRLTEAEKEERSQKDAEEKARREITDIVKEVEEEAKQRQIQNKIEELAAKLVGKTREQMGEEEAKELEKERKAL